MSLINSLIPADAPAGKEGEVQVYSNGNFKGATELQVSTNTVEIVPPANLDFGSTTRQMINFWGAQYGIGVQANTFYCRTFQNFAWYKEGSHGGGEFDAGGGSVQMVIDSTGNVGIGTSDPASKLHVTGKTDIHQGNQPRFDGLRSPTTDSGRAQLVLSSAYSDLIIASSFVNNTAGSTLTFAAYNPVNAGEYRKWVINQGNWGARKQFLDFGYQDADGILNPHQNIAPEYTTLTLDGVNKRVGIGTINPTHTLDVAGSLNASGATTLGGTLTVNGAAINFSNLPSSDPAVAGQIWNNNGTLSISAG